MSVVFQSRVVRIFKDKKTGLPSGYALGGIEGRVAIHYVNVPENSKDNFSFKCHRSSPSTATGGQSQEIFAVSQSKSGTSCCCCCYHLQ